MGVVHYQDLAGEPCFQDCLSMLPRLADSNGSSALPHVLNADDAGGCWCLNLERAVGL